MAASCSRGVRPSGWISVICASTSLRMPDTRTMKNSSMFEPKMDRNFTRSSSGLFSSCASSRTRRWNSSRLELAVEVQRRSESKACESTSVDTIGDNYPPISTNCAGESSQSSPAQRPYCSFSRDNRQTPPFFKVIGKGWVAGNQHRNQVAQVWFMTHQGQVLDLTVVLIDLLHQLVGIAGWDQVIR